MKIPRNARFLKKPGEETDLEISTLMKYILQWRVSYNSVEVEAKTEWYEALLLSLLPTI